jgi:transcriptional regulator with XRE-family HTH domain
VEYVPGICDHTYMANTGTVGEALLDLKRRADLSLDKIAERAGYKGKSSIQEYFKPEYEGPLGSRAAVKLATAFEGLGIPPITWAEIMALAGATPVPNAKPVKFEGASQGYMSPDLPIYGTALGAEIIVEGEAIEQTTLNKGEIIGYAKRPVILNGNPDVYGLHVQGSSMDPVHPEGSFIVAQKDKPLRIGDDVVVYLRPRDDTDDGQRATQVLVKRLVRRTAQYVELRQFSPDTTFRIATSDVLRTDRVLTLGDLLS